MFEEKIEKWKGQILKGNKEYYDFYPAGDEKWYARKPLKIKEIIKAFNEKIVDIKKDLIAELELSVISCMNMVRHSHTELNLVGYPGDKLKEVRLFIIQGNYNKQQKAKKGSV